MAHPHDTGYTALFMLPERVQQLIEEFAPAAIGELLDCSTLRRHPGNFITPLFTGKIEGAVWSLKLKPKAAGTPAVEAGGPSGKANRKACWRAAIEQSALKMLRLLRTAMPAPP